MISFVLTTAGAAAKAASASGGTKLNIKTFRLGSSVGYVPLVSDSSLRGVQVYSGNIQDYTIDSNSVVRLNCLLDETVGNFSFGECALYLENGTMYALGSLAVLQRKEKTAAKLLGNTVVVQAVIGLQPSDNATFTIPSNVGAKFLTAPSVDALKPPVNADSNLYLTDSLNANGSSIIAQRTSDLGWSFIDYTKVYSGTVKPNGVGYTSATTATVSGGGASVQAVVIPIVSPPSAPRQMHLGNIVDTFIYNVKADTDNGLWLNRCSNTSWYKEAINKDWLPSYATATLAWGDPNAKTGAYFQNSTDLKFYVLGASSPAASETFRGNTRGFPTKVALVLHTTAGLHRLTIYDLTQPNTPMWMSFYSNLWGGSGTFFATGYPGSSATKVTMLNGQMFMGVINPVTTPSVSGLSYVNFIKDTFGKVSKSTSWCGNGVGIANRNGYNSSWYNIDTTTGAEYQNLIIDEQVNDVSVTALTGAPIDPVTLLPYPTIAIGTNSGVSIIRTDYTVVNWITTFGQSASVTINSSGQLFSCGGPGNSYHSFYKSSIPTSTPDNSFTYVFDETSIPARLGTNAATGAINKHCSIGGGYRVLTSYNCHMVYVMADNPASPTTGMVAQISNLFNTGWQLGDIRGCWMSDTVAGVATSVECVSNGAFTTNTAGWVQNASGSPTMSVVAGQVVCNSGTASNQLIGQNITTLVGLSYQVVFTKISTEFMAVYAVSGNSSQLGPFASGAGVFTYEFIADSTTTTISINGQGASSTGTIDNVSCKLFEPDRSVKLKGMTVVGSITKAPVAAGAQLVGYSGLSNSNYLIQPYNTRLDFGTGDFSIMGWVNLTSLASISELFHRGLTGQGGGILIRVVTTGVIEVYGSTTTSFVLLAQSVVPLVINTPNLVELSRSGGVLRIRLNGVQVGSATDATNLTYVNAVTVLGARLDVTSSLSGYMALWRVSATSPSVSQAARIYATELSLFQSNAKCVIAGTTDLVQDVTYDSVQDVYHLATSYGRSSFQNLLRVDSEATSVGGVTSISALQGALITGGTNLAKYYTQVEAEGAITGVNIVSYGSGYSSTPTITFSVGTGATATATLTRGVSSYTLVSGGSGYVSPPAVNIVGGGGFGATATATINLGQVTGITVSTPGYGYSGVPVIALLGGGGSGASATAIVTNVIKDVQVSTNSRLGILDASSIPALTAGAPAGSYIIQFTSGANQGYSKVIVSNGLSEIKWANASYLGSTPKLGTTFDVFASNATLQAPSTQPLLDSTNNLATTEFVKTSGYKFKGMIGNGGNVTLTTADLGNAYIVGNTGRTTTIPNPTVCPSGTTISIMTSGVSHTITTPSGWIYTAQTASPSFLLDVNEAVQLITNGTDWFAISQLDWNYETRPILDGTTFLATTEFVSKVGVTHSSIGEISEDAVLGTGGLGRLYIVVAAGKTATLPPIALCPSGTTVTFVTLITSNLVVKGSGAELIVQLEGDFNTITLSGGSSLQVVSDGTKWFISNLAGLGGSTPPLLDNTKRLSTTEFVNNKGVSYKILTGYVGGQGYAVSDVGGIVVITANGTTVLPNISSVAYGTTLTITCNPGVNTLLQAGGADWIAAGSSEGPTLQMYGGESVQLVAKIDEWFASSYRPTTAVTPASNNNNAVIATTAFVQNLIAARPAFAAAGTRMLFSQASAPAGWTQSGADIDNNRLMRVVASAGGGGGGVHSPIYNDVVVGHVHSFTTADPNANHTHGVADPGHTHPGGETNIQNLIGGGSGAYVRLNYQTQSRTGSSVTGITLGTISQVHQHGGSTDGGSSNTPWSPRYVDIICCTKN